MSLRALSAKRGHHARPSRKRVRPLASFAKAEQPGRRRTDSRAAAKCASPLLRARANARREVLRWSRRCATGRGFRRSAAPGVPDCGAAEDTGAGVAAAVCWTKPAGAPGSCRGSRCKRLRCQRRSRSRNFSARPSSPRSRPTPRHPGCQCPRARSESSARGADA